MRPDNLLLPLSAWRCTLSPGPTRILKKSAQKDHPILKRLLTLTPAALRRPAPALAAGAIGGLISGFFKLGWEVPWPPRAPGRIPEPQVLVTLFTHTPTPGWASLVIHFVFSVFFGALYGLLVEFLPIAALGTGVVYGLAIWIGAHEIVMPLMGLTPAAWLLPASEQGSEFFGHALWGFVIGVFYEDLRRRFTQPPPAA